MRRHSIRPIRRQTGCGGVRRFHPLGFAGLAFSFSPEMISGVMRLGRRQAFNFCPDGGRFLHHAAPALEFRATLDHDVASLDIPMQDAGAEDLDALTGFDISCHAAADQDRIRNHVPKNRRALSHDQQRAAALRCPHVAVHRAVNRERALEPDVSLYAGIQSENAYVTGPRRRRRDHHVALAMQEAKYAFHSFPMYAVPGNQDG